MIKAKRIIYNRNSNDWNSEHQYKLQKVRVYEETPKNYIVDSYGNFKFKVNKNEIFLNKQDFIEKIDKIKRYRISEYDKEYLIKEI